MTHRILSLLLTLALLVLMTGCHPSEAFWH